MTSGEREFFDWLYMNYFFVVYRYSLAIVKEPLVAEEVAQDVFLTALSHLDVLMKAEKPDRWLRKTAKYKCMHVFRERAKWRKWMVSWEDAGTEPVATDQLVEVEEEENLQQLKESIRKVLTKEELALVRLVALEEKSYLTAAKQLGVTVSACQKRMQRIRKKLQKRFPEWGQ